MPASKAIKISLGYSIFNAPLDATMKALVGRPFHTSALHATPAPAKILNSGRPQCTVAGI